MAGYCMIAQLKSQIVDQWVEKAENDLRNATIVIGEKDPPTDTVCFHCHQTAEKYLKAFLLASGKLFRKVHDLKYLLNECSSVDAEFKTLEEEIDILNMYYIESRYPLDMPIRYPVGEAGKAVDFAHDVKKFVSAKLGQVVR